MLRSIWAANTAHESQRKRPFCASMAGPGTSRVEIEDEQICEMGWIVKAIRSSGAMHVYLGEDIAPQRQVLFGLALAKGVPEKLKRG